MTTVRTTPAKQKKLDEIKDEIAKQHETVRSAQKATIEAKRALLNLARKSARTNKQLASTPKSLSPKHRWREDILETDIPAYLKETYQILQRLIIPSRYGFDSSRENLRVLAAYYCWACKGWVRGAPISARFGATKLDGHSDIKPDCQLDMYSCSICKTILDAVVVE